MSRLLRPRGRRAPGKAQTALHTELAVDAREVFLSYQHSADAACDVTFNLRDFKAALALCEALHADVAIRFGQPGSPLVVEPHVSAHSEQAPPWTPAEPALHPCTTPSRPPISLDRLPASSRALLGQHGRRAAPSVPRLWFAGSAPLELVSEGISNVGSGRPRW